MMELATSGTERATTGDRFDSLADAYRCFVTGSHPRQSAADVAEAIFSGVCGPVPGEGGGRKCAAAAYCHDNRVEMNSMSLSLVEKIASSLTSQSLLPSAAGLYCMEVLRVLFQDMDLMSQLVQRFRAEDQIISHLAAKSVSACVFYHLVKSGTVSPVWEQTCVEVFQSSSPGTVLDSCLWSLTDVLKRLLKGAHQEILGKLLAAFDSSLCALCLMFLPEERKEVQCLGEFTSSSEHWETTSCLLLDLLEVLTASSLTRGAGVCLKCQRLTHLHSSVLLMTVSRSSSKYFVKKRALLLLKRAVLQTAGEDWALGDALSTGLKYELFNSDMSTLAQSVLTAVAANWLQSVQVELASFFGGTRNVRGDDGQKPDCVMLRAVSLLVLKSMELHIQTTGGAAGTHSAMEVYRNLQSLWGFLKRHSVQLMELTHLCCWVSQLFGEQDDDMMEAAKALLSIFLHHRQCSGLDDSAVLEAACASGCNPHCHFLLLLQSISFDHSPLLDFLISTETCFLEYFVRYLKYLQADWQGFTAACGRISHCHVSQQKSLPARFDHDTFELLCQVEPHRVEFSSCSQPTEITGLAAGPRLVEYGSSDESDPEAMGSQDEAGTFFCEKMSCSALDGNQEMSGTPVPTRQKSSHLTGLLNSPNFAPGKRPEGSSLSAPLSRQATCETSAQAVRCLSELREVVTRLQTKKLFPYNPSSLLNLLAQVLSISLQSHLSYCNKC